jgi:hypothetical protein
MGSGEIWFRAMASSKPSGLLLLAQKCPGLIRRKKEDTGLRCGGRGKSEITSALRMCFLIRLSISLI